MGTSRIAESMEDRIRPRDLPATILRPPELLTFRYGGQDFRLTNVTEQVVRGIPISALR